VTLKNCVNTLVDSNNLKTILVSLLAIINYINNSNHQGFQLETLSNVKKDFFNYSINKIKI